MLTKRGGGGGEIAPCTSSAGRTDDLSRASEGNKNPPRPRLLVSGGGGRILRSTEPIGQKVTLYYSAAAPAAQTASRAIKFQPMEFA